MRNSLLSKKLKRTETRLLIIDDNQIRYNQILELLDAKGHQVKACLLDDIKSFEKQLHNVWDVVIFGRAYDLKVEQAIALIQASKQPHLPVLMLKPEDYQFEQYMTFINKGIYDLVNLDYSARFYIDVIRALSYSRLVQTQQHLEDELENAQSQAQSLVEDSNKAVAIIQEGIHLQANPEYLALFGFKHEDEIIGLPLLDVLQPADLNDFKQRFKKISQGQFDQACFEMHTRQSQAASKNPLHIEFLPAAEEDALQLTIDCGTASNYATPHSKTTEGSEKSVLQQPAKTYQHINRTLLNQPANCNALVSVSLATCPNEIFHTNLNTLQGYFHNIQNFLKEQTHLPVFKIETGLFAVLVQAESASVLKSRLAGLAALEKPQLLAVGNSSYPLHLKLGYAELKSELGNEDQLEELLNRAFHNSLATLTQASDLELSAKLETTPLGFEADPKLLQQPTILQALQQKLESGDIRLKYQQLYDKYDTNLYTYEVTSGFIYENQWHNLADFKELADDPELSIKVDRWVLVEACKQLHNFITQYPEAKLIVNLNAPILLEDPQFPQLVAKLLTIVGSRVSHPLILQFSEKALNHDLPLVQKQMLVLRQHGAEISLRDFGMSMYSDSFLNQVEINYLSLDSRLSTMLADDVQVEQLQEKIANFLIIRPVEILLSELNDMNLFANAWNVEARYLQGDYFQKKLDHLSDVQDH